MSTQSSSQVPSPNAVPPRSIWDSSARTSTPISQRPKARPRQLIVFLIVFFSYCFLAHLAQLCLLPFAFFSKTRTLYEQGINFTKKLFGILLLFCIQTFAPAKIRLTLQKGLSREDVLDSVNTLGPLKLRLPRRSVVMSNHQVYLDWMFIWIMLYFSDLHGSIVIILKNTLKWIPILGPAMQFYDFIFLARNWEADKVNLQQSLASMGKRASSSQEPLTLLIFPEGTLVSKDTRPISTKFANQNGYPDMKHTLLPRSTGLLTCLRALAPKVPDLKLIDLTIGYEGVPPNGYGQDYYTLASCFGQGDSPPQLHIHYRVLSLAELPIGQISGDGQEATQAEKDAFASWVLQQWRIKDALLGHFYETGSFEGGDNVASDTATDMPLQLLDDKDVLRLVGGILPGLAITYETTKVLIKEMFY